MKIVFRHDTIGAHMGVSGASFEARNPDIVRQMKRLTFDYINSLQGMLTRQSTDKSVPTDNPAIIEITPEGYPKLIDSFNPLTCLKQPLEDHLHNYLGQHYCK